MDRIILKEEYIKSNLLYEEDITKSLIGEIEVIDEYLEFIFEHKENEIIIKRNTINVESKDEDYCPSTYYGVGKEIGTYVVKDDECADKCCDDDSYFEKVLSYNWIEWEISYENTNYRDSFEIIITPFVFNMYSFSSALHKDNNGYNREKINIFTSTFYDKWNDKIKDIVVNKKKSKIKTMINDSYKILGIDRQAKIKSILKEE
jgi:hypothetical protein